jgi:hypothetical protein
MRRFLLSTEYGIQEPFGMKMSSEQTNTLPCLPMATLGFNLSARARVAAFCLAICTHASAAVINTYPDWDGNVTLSYSKVAQSFLAPTDNFLASWQFTLAPNSAPTNLLFQIVSWNPLSGPSGAALFTRNLSWPAQGGDVLVDNINLSLTPGARYAAVIDFNGYRGQSVFFEYNQNSYNHGNASWFGGINPTWVYLNSTYNTEFRAEFLAVPEPVSLLALALAVPTLLRHPTRTRLIPPATQSR